MESKTTALDLKSFLRRGQGDGGLWLTHYYRYLGAIAAWASAALGIHPNVLTLLSALSSLCGGIVLIVVPSVGWGAAMLSLALFALGYMLDCADGQLARACGSGSKLGAWLDHTLDCWKFVLVNACLGWVAIRQSGDVGIPIWVPYLAANVNLAGSLVYFFGWTYKVSLVGSDRTAAAIASKRLRQLLTLPLHITDYGLFLGLWFFLPNPDRFTWIYLGYGVVTSAVYFGYLAVSAWGMRRD